MGYSKEIIVYQNPNLQKSQIFQLYKQLTVSGWTIQSSHDDGMISYSIDPENGFIKSEYKSTINQFEELLKNVESQRKWISFKITNKELERSATLFHNGDIYTFDLEIYKEDYEYENHLFQKFHDSIYGVVESNFFLNKIEWRSNYGNEVIKCFIDLITEGVLVIASSNQIKKYYSNHEFDYDFPYGIKNLIDEEMIIVIECQNEDFLTIIDFGNEQAPQNTVSSKLKFLGENDELLILSHSDFTQICAYHNGDIESYGWKHIVNIPMANIENGEFQIWKEGNDDNLRLKLNMANIEDSVKNNGIFNIEEIPTHNKA